MPRLSEYIALEIEGETISLREVLRFAKWGRSTFIKDAVDAVLIRQAAAERGIKVSDEEFQQEADSFRTERDLYDADTTEAWLAENYLSYTEWEALLEDEMIKRKLRDALTAGAVEKHFVEQRLSLDAAAISRLVLKEEGVARELRAQIVEDGADFHALAREYSIDPATRPAGGYAGRMRRSEMEAGMEAAIFGAQPGKTVGPIKTYDGWELVKVEALHPAILDDAMRETIKSELFGEWLNKRRLKAKISMPLLEQDEYEVLPLKKSQQPEG
jgi:putative peptide maturation system protein